MLAALYSVIRLLVDILATVRRDHDELAAEVLALRRQVQVLERQIKRVRWACGARKLSPTRGGFRSAVAIMRV